MTAERTIAGMFDDAARRCADRPFLHAPRDVAALYDLDRRDWTYGEAGAAVFALAREYEAAGVGPGSRIGLAIDNRPDFFLHFLAINARGASVVPLASAMTEGELEYQVAHAECALIVVTAGHGPRLAAIAARAPHRPQVVEPRRIASAKLSFSMAPVRSAANGAREAAVLYTSGTTGKPKGCVLSNDYFLAIADLYTGLGGHVRFEEGAERIVTPLPVTHMNALACSFMAAVKTGSCLIQLDRFHPKTWWRTLRESRATIMHYLGVMPAMLLKAPAADDDFSGQLKFGFGAGCDPRHHAAFEERFGAPLIEAWAMTETGAGAWIAASKEPRHVGTRCFGRAPSGLEWRLVDEEDDDVAEGEAGELLVRRAGVDPRAGFFSGYLKDEAATEEAWRGGWFHTGDVVRVDDGGFFYFVDRRKNVIRRSGENIAAIEVESALLRSPLVSACAVAPAPDDVRGEEVAALVVSASGRRDEACAREIFDLAMNELSYFKAPGYIAFVDALPLTASEKVNRSVSKALARAAIDRGDAYDLRLLKKRREA